MSVLRPTIDPPPAHELLLLVAEFLALELAPAQADPKLRYRTLVAANLLRIARRELDGIDEFELDRDGAAVPAGFAADAGSVREWADDLYRGRKLITDRAAFELATRYVEAKLKLAVPEALARSTDAASPP